MKQKDIKLLWGRSGNKCAICRTELTVDNKTKSAAFTLGEQAHIVGEKEDSPRGKSILTLEERKGYHNRILLCPNDHTKIDKNEKDWPIEKLHKIKSEHELWANENLSSSTNINKQATDLIISSIIDSAVELCDLRNWKNWTSYSLSPAPKWPEEKPSEIFEFREKVIAAIWPNGYDELKNSIITLSVFLNDAAQTFSVNSNEVNGFLFPVKFYKMGGWNENYHKDLKRYVKWVEKCHKLILDATKAANWFAEIVRRDINPLFFAEHGKFLINKDVYSETSFYSRVLEFSEEEKKKLPDKLFDE